MNTPKPPPKQERLPPAPRTPLPELAEFLAPLRVQFTHGPSAATLRQEVTGLLSEQPNKNCDTLAEVVPATSEQQLPYLRTDMSWDEQALNRQRSAQMLTVPSAGDGGRIFEDTGLEKKGRHAVGVAQQYTGTVGKITHGQVTGKCQYAERTRAWPASRGQHGEWKYFWSDFPPTTPLAVLVEYAHRRHGVEQYQEEAKTALGWDQYQGRRWDGFHRHAVLVMVSYSFLVWVEARTRGQRQGSGRPRAAFSPRPDRRRLSLPEVHRRVSEWLRQAAIRELLALGLLPQYFSPKLQL